MLPGTREGEEVPERRRGLGHHRFLGPASAHGDDDDATRPGQEPRHVARDGRLAHPLPRADHRESRDVERGEGDRVEPEVGADVREACGERPGGEPEATARADDRLVREIDDRVDLHLLERIGERVPKRDAVVRLAVAQLLRAAQHDGADDLVRERRERVAHDVRVVLAVDQRERSH